MFILFAIIFICFICAYTSYVTHIHMNKKEKLPYDYVSFKTFIREFNKYKYNPRLERRENNNSIILKKDNDYVLYLHASIVKIDGKCMIFYPVDWFRYCIWIKRFNKPKGNRVKGLWDGKK